MGKNDFMKYKEFENSTQGSGDSGSDFFAKLLYWIVLIGGGGFAILCLVSGYWYVAIIAVIIALIILGS